jgi:predicted DNA-binding transcriptional regulator AlpA
MDTSLLEALKDPLLSAFDQLPAHVQLTSAQVALLLQVSKRALEEWRVRGEPPPWVELSPRTIRYPAGALKDWLNERLAHAPKSTSESQKKKKAALEGLDEPILSAGRKRSRHDTFKAYLAQGLLQDEWLLIFAKY